MKRTEPQVVDLEAEELQGMLRRAERKQFRDEDYETAQVLARSYAYLTDVLKGKEISVGRLRKMLFGAGTEKTDAVVVSTAGCEASARSEEAPGRKPTAASPSETPAENDPALSNGHGRNGVDAYEGAEKVEVLHESLEPGDSCPDCGQGTVYDMRRGGVLVRITGQGQLRLAMELSLELMDQGSYQVEMSDQGLMTDDIEECLKVVIQALRKSDLPASELMTWCRGMLEKDRVGFICEEELKALQHDLEASGSE